MSRFSATLAASQTLSMAGFEEASRFDRTTADLDDLLVALVRDEGAGGQALRAAGATLEGVRSAILTTQTDQLRSLGVDITPTRRGPARRELAGSQDWSPRAMRVFQTAPASKAFSLSALRTLLDEPSGLVVAVLTAAGVSPDDLRHSIDASAQAPLLPAERAADHLRESASAFVPADPNAVWQWLVTPENTSLWSTPQEAIENTEHPHVWRTRTAASPDSRTRQDLRLLTLAEDTAPVTLRWEIAVPDVPRANDQLIGFDLAPASGGTHLTVTVEWINRRGVRRSPLARLARPIVRRITRLQARVIGQAVAGRFADR